MVMASPLLREFVVLLDNNGTPTGTADKATVHTADTPLHSAFSVFLFDGNGRMLVQQRAFSKKTWPGIWSNACCGHPFPGETVEAAAHRRLRHELGLTGLHLVLMLPEFRYRAEHRGIVEHEVCPVFVAVCHDTPTSNPDEVAAVKWISWQRFAEACSRPENGSFAGYSPWSLMEGCLLQAFPFIRHLSGGEQGPQGARPQPTLQSA
jgi:isopentenyl-diphosphate delta-isomerase